MEVNKSRNMIRRKINLISVITLLWVLAGSLSCEAGSPSAERAAHARYIHDHYPTQLTLPNKKKRMSMSQFGYGLYYFDFPLFAVTDFINPHHFGKHSYGKPAMSEKNGSLYTCRGGFMDFSHIRAAADWTVYMTFRIICEDHSFDLEPEGGTMSITFKNIDALSTEDITDMSRKITFERLEWHEVASWYYHLPNYSVSEQQSTFTPEDTYSNFLGTVIGKRIALRILRKQENLPYSQIASEEIQKMITSLQPMQTVRATKQAYDIVDLRKQMKVPADQRNDDVWWDSQIIFRDERYVFKRYINIGPSIDPWLVPHAEKVGCPVTPEPEVFAVPDRASTGQPFYDYYNFVITPAPALFFTRQTRHLMQEQFNSFSTRDMLYIITHVALDMEKELHPGFDQRDHKNPIADFKKLRKVFFK
jgi:hypothetical protein